MKDGFDLPTTTRSPEARDCYVRGVEMFLAAELGVEAMFEAAIAADEGLALAYLGIARQTQMMGDRARMLAALDRAEALAGGLSAREKGQIHFHTMMMRGKAGAALEFARDEHLKDYPRDAMVAGACSGVFGLIGFSGRAGRDAETLAFMTALESAAGQDWWFQTQHGFAQLELGWFGPAEKLLDKAYAAFPASAHTAHIKAHLFYETGQRDSGVSFLSDWRTAHGDGGTMACHITWHQALWALEQGDIASVWRLFDAGIRPGVENAPPINVFTDAAALLLRADLAGHRVDVEKWQAVSDFADHHFGRPGILFVDLHAAVAHAMAGNHERLARILDGAKGPNADRLRAVAQAFRAMAAQDWAAATDHLSRCATGHVRFGGSNAQRDLIDLAYAACLARRNSPEEARLLLQLRRPMLSAEAVVAGLG